MALSKTLSTIHDLSCCFQETLVSTVLRDEIPLKLYLCRKKNRSSYGSCVTCKADLEDDSMFENLNSGIGGNGARNE